MRFFKKVGRPTDEEQMIIDAIGNIIQTKGISIENVPDCNNLDDLLTAIDLLETIKIETPEVIEESTSNTIEDELSNKLEDAPIESKDDLKELDTNKIESTIESVEQIIEEEVIISETALPDFNDSDYDPFAEPILERSYNKVSDDTSTSEDSEIDELNLSEGKTPLDELNPNTKRKAAEQTADAILKGYKNFAPEPFKWWCKFPERKIEEMTFDGEIDGSIEVEQGVSFDEYIKQTNAQINEIFEVQEETLEEIKEPLVDVLMEQELELTPSQRLGMAVLSHLLQMFTMAMKLYGQNNRILEYQKHLTEITRQNRTNAA